MEKSKETLVQEEEERVLFEFHNKGFRTGKGNGSDEQKAFMRLYKRCQKRRIKNKQEPLFGKSRNNQKDVSSDAIALNETLKRGRPLIDESVDIDKMKQFKIGNNLSNNFQDLKITETISNTNQRTMFLIHPTSVNAQPISLPNNFPMAIRYEPLQTNISPPVPDTRFTILKDMSAKKLVDDYKRGLIPNPTEEQCAIVNEYLTVESRESRERFLSTVPKFPILQ